MKVLALDVSTTTTGFAIINNNSKLIEYGQFSIKDRPLSDTLYAYSITEKSLKLAKKHQVDNIIIENIYYASNPEYFRTWARVHGGIAVQWYKKTRKEPIFMMAVVARPKIGINGKANKIEIQLEIAKRFKLIKDEKYYDFCSKFNELLKQKKAKQLTRNQFDYRVKKLSENFEKEINLSEHQADSIVLGLAYFR